MLNQIDAVCGGVLVGLLVLNCNKINRTVSIQVSDRVSPRVVGSFKRGRSLKRSVAITEQDGVTQVGTRGDQIQGAIAVEVTWGEGNHA